MLDGHGDDIYNSPSGIVANFSSNVWYGGCRPELSDFLCKHLAKVNYYPEVIAYSLAKRLEECHSVAPGSVLVTNGAVEAIYIISQCFAGAQTLIITPSFAEYEDACQMHRHQLHFDSIDNLCEDYRFKSKLIFFCNPNNPTGHVFSRAVVEKWISSSPGSVFVLDEAYCGFSLEDSSCLSLISKYSNLLIIRSMTKKFSIPGLRLGYVVAQPELIGRLLKCKMPWSVNALAIEAGHFVLNNPEPFALPVKELLAETQRFAKEIANIPSVEVLPTSTNFFLCRLAQGTAAELKSFMLKEYGILIRDASNFRGLTPGHFRLSTLDPERNQLFIKALRKWIQRSF
jgi:threonine-phosphate decarboxylase